MKNQYTLGNLIITAPGPWKDITDPVEGSDVPFTLAKDDGTGALQFSVATYKSGKIPNVSLQDLDELRIDFAEKKQLGKAFAEVNPEGILRVSGGSYQTTQSFVRVWYCSDGKNIALITCLADKGKEDGEPGECDAIVSVIRFRQAETL
ncbi:MAG TPA: hypothetical protein VHY22_12820 [Chthoniobacteraceae bacterium]|jgi:hypothetical protein|nr:hypothetical protein [Chthoniobacteraceae bacterium]